MVAPRSVREDFFATIRAYSFMASTSDRRFAGAIPELYETYLVPLIFAPYAVDLAVRVAGQPADRVLEIAAGTGVVTRELAHTLPPETALVATDLNQAMLDRAAAVGTSRPVEWRQADALRLPFDDAAFDVVVCQFGVMFFPDKPAAFGEARRVLKPGGTLLFNVWSRMDANPFAEISNDAAKHFLPANPPKFYLTPFGYADVERVEADLTLGGFGDVSHEIVRFDKEVRDWEHFAYGTIYGNPMIVDLRAGGINPDDVWRWIAAKLQARFGKAPAKMPLEAIVYEAR